MLKQDGLTLVELMVSMLLGLFLMGGMLQLYIHNLKSYQLQEELARIQENALFAFEVLGHELRMAGSGGCIVPSKVANIISGVPENWPPLQNRALQGFDSDHQFNDWSTLFNRVQAGTDAFVSTRIDSALPYTVGQSPAQFKQSTIPLEHPHQLKAGTPLSIRSVDCQQQGLFVYTPKNTKKRSSTSFEYLSGQTAKNGLKNCSTKITGHFDCSTEDASTDSIVPTIYTGGQVSQLVSKGFFIRPGSDKAVPALYQQSLHGYAEELVSGIENMQLTYGVDYDNDQQVDQRLSAAQVKNWAQVHSVQIDLLVRSLTPVAEKPLPYVFRDKQHLPKDRYLRQVLSQNVQLRHSPPIQIREEN